MPSFSRYAVYYAPAPGAFADFAAEWLGWDPAQGRAVAQPDLPGLPRPVAEITAEPHKYGFHGTLKPPFHLVAGTDEGGLIRALDALAAGLAPVTLPGLALNRLGRFLALTPAGDTAPLAALAADVVRGLDPFRAPLTEADRARRNPDRLSPRQRDYLDRWGYPYVMEEFRFHLTLTGPMPEHEAELTRTVLTPVLDPLLPRPFVVRDLVLFGQAQDGRFHILHRSPLG